jgi:hypothetical protein
LKRTYKTSGQLCQGRDIIDTVKSIIMRTTVFLIFIIVILADTSCSKTNGDNSNTGNTGNTGTAAASKVKVETYAGNTIGSIVGPGSMCMDQTGYLYVAETGHNVVVKIDPLAQTVGHFAGIFNTPGCVDDPFGSGTQSLTFPDNVWMGSDQQVYIGDYGCQKTKIANTTGALASLDYLNPNNLSPGVEAACKDYKGNIFMLDPYTGLYEVRAQDHVLVQVLSGTDLGIASSMTTNAAQSTIYIAAKHQVLEYNGTSLVSIAGDSLGNSDGQGKKASFGGAMEICTGTDGNIYVADINNNLVRQVTPNGLVTTLAGDGKNGYADGSGDKAEFSGPSGIAFTTSGSNNVLFVSDFGNNRIRKLSFPK